jgi:hypothetical protein
LKVKHISVTVNELFYTPFGQTMIFVLVVLAAFAAGFINAVAGGGSFLTFSVLIAAGLPPIAANASSAVALFPGQIATGYAARDGLAAASADSRVNVPILATISLAGGLIGGLLLLVTPQTVFGRIVPWLILFATAIFETAAIEHRCLRSAYDHPSGHCELDGHTPVLAHRLRGSNAGFQPSSQPMSRVIRERLWKTRRR